MSDATGRPLCGGANRRRVEKTQGRNKKKGPQPFFRWTPGNRRPGVDSAAGNDEEASLATPREDVLPKGRTATIRKRRNRRREGRWVVLQACNSVCKNPTDESLRRGGCGSIQKSGRQLCSATNDIICGVRDPGQWKEATVRSLRKASDALQRATFFGPSRSVARNISMEWQFCWALFGEDNKKSREAGRAGRQRRPSSQASPGQPGLLRGDFPHASARKGSRRGSDGRKIAGHCGPDGRGACRQMFSYGRKTVGQGLPIRLRKQGDGKPTGSCKAPVIGLFARSADSRERTRTNRRTSNLAGWSLPLAGKVSLGGWWSETSRNAVKKTG